ncbi:outer membrane beta-barrel protein [Pontibacter oryzae]|uniref:Outer membrane protein beta-barrel domain-containing protein n=1 Tax=Pontibacter oryzae TaxID=2304593 RepID=A0A399S3T2_9BACT|nr:outer membrane beta-barrel protein [Pontibacter oryzae]RIJ36722.1 hypothetical protein D1627_12860 [Pontibacter oryzae]
MSSATNNQRNSMEEEFQRRMQNAEATPSGDLWNRIDHQLTVQENSQYKRGMLFYRQLAAACVTLLIVAGSMAAFYFSKPTKGPEALTLDSLTTKVPMPEAGQAASITDEAIASAMQQAVQAYEPVKQQPIVAEAVPERPGSVESNLSYTSKPASALGLSRAKAPQVVAPNTFAWYNVAGTNNAFYTSVFSEKSGRSVQSRFPAIQQEFSGKKVTTGFGSVIISSGFMGDDPVQAIEDDFTALSRAVMSRVKALGAEQESMAHRLKAEQELALAGLPENEQNPKSGRWSLGLAYAPSYFEQNIGTSAQSAIPTAFTTLAPPSAMQASTLMAAEAREEYKEEVEPGFSFGIELKTGFKLGKKWRLLSGLGFTQNTARSKSSYVLEQNHNRMGPNGSGSAKTFFVPTLNQTDASSPESLTKTDDYEVQYRYRHLTVPAGIQYEGNLSKDWFWFAGGGVAANILLESSVLASAADVEDVDYSANDKDSPFRKLQWSGNATAGLGKRLSDNISVTVGPEFRSYFDTMLASPEKAMAPQGKPYTMGLNLAVNYDLGAGRR